MTMLKLASAALTIAALTGVGLAAAAPAQAAGTCTKVNLSVNASRTAATVKNPCTNLSGRYQIVSFNAKNQTTGSATFTVAPGGSATWNKGSASDGYYVNIL
ncbi:hypothetical protein IT072_01875 [Leifsonia sp. ZF2019]|uniref:hypothetical protein n=1 Tax=Leifsonia sp. ZF2019 TaxID=2781978 RepID=UPI001CBE36F1|nr:hypothetical protein [Leifsonia sp. ZF2019]UAJ79852.1 hypothetical protein IT072_01875 [Leifsonia sp. ZF2019]